MPRTEPKIEANNTAVSKKTLAVKLAPCLITCLIRRLHSLRRVRAVCGDDAMLTSGADARRSGEGTRASVRRTESIQLWRQLQQEGGARVDWERETSAAGEAGLGWPRCGSTLRAKEAEAGGCAQAHRWVVMARRPS